MSLHTTYGSSLPILLLPQRNANGNVLHPIHFTHGISRECWCIVTERILERHRIKWARGICDRFEQRYATSWWFTQQIFPTIQDSVRTIVDITPDIIAVNDDWSWYSYVFGGSSHLITSIFIKQLRHLEDKRINRKGVAKISRNLMALQQNLTNIIVSQVWPATAFQSMMNHSHSLLLCCHVYRMDCLIVRVNIMNYWIWARKIWLRSAMKTQPYSVLMRYHSCHCSCHGDYPYHWLYHCLIW